jgi:uncharacterized phiE125 gp8 family phage protein
MANLRIVTPPTAEPVSVAEVLAQIRLDDDGGTHPEEAFLSSLITGARQAAERFTGRCFTDAVYELRVDGFADQVALPVAPVRGLLPVAYRDASGQLAGFAGSAFLDDHPFSPAVLLRPAAGGWPATDGFPGAVQLRFRGAHGPAATGGTAVDRDVVHAILLTVAHLYKNREDVVTSQTYQLVGGSESLLRPHRRNIEI